MSESKEDINQVLSRAELIYDANQIATALDDIAQQLDESLTSKNPLALCVMQGGLIFTGHLLTRLKCNPEIDYIHATRYQNKTLGNELNWLAYPKSSLQDRTVLILDDILDEGITLHSIIEYCYSQGAKEVVAAVLLHKKHDRCKPGVTSDFIALEVEDRYVFGFGMDYKGQFRNLNAIYAVG